MRMRRKKNLDIHLAECGVYYSELREDSLDLRKEEYHPIDVDALFNRNAPILLEIGCGKGAFAIELAKRFPEYNIIAVEKCKNVILTACQNAKEQNISNLRFFCGGAEYLHRHLPKNSVDRIFLNFSCPFPKNKYAMHRLTSPVFLPVYKTLLKKDGEIHQKTDHPRLFEFSIEHLTNAGFKLKNVTVDLHNSGFEGNIMTEYEQMFVNMGKPIYRLEAYM